MIQFFKRLFSNPEQDILIQKFETLLSAMESNTREQYVSYSQKLKTY